MLILLGEGDPYQTPSSRAYYRSLATQHPGVVEYYDVPGALHGVLAPIPGHPGSFASVMQKIDNLVAQITGQ